MILFEPYQYIPPPHEKSFEVELAKKILDLYLGWRKFKRTHRRINDVTNDILDELSVLKTRISDVEKRLDKEES